MKVVSRSIDSIRPYENNPRRNQDAITPVANSIREFGWQQPIVVDKDGVIIAGHTRWLAAMQLGYTEVPVVVANLNEEQARAYRLADNKTGELAGWDFHLLDVELADIGIKIDMEQFGFDAISEIEEWQNDSRLKPAPENKGALAERYLVPPFSILRAYAGEWLNRKRMWTNKGICSEEGRADGLTYGRGHKYGTY